MPKGWSKGETKETHESVKKISNTMRERGVDNFKEWREQAKKSGRIPSEYPELGHSGDLAELIGVVLGDGHIYAHDRCDGLRIVGNANNPQFAERYASIIQRLFNKRPSIIERSREHALNITLYQKHIANRLGIPTGSKLDYEFKLPQWIEDSSEYSIRFLRGLYEAEGSVSHHVGTYTHKLIFSNKNQSITDVVLRLLSRLGFHPHYSPYQVQISRREEVQNLQDLLQFRDYSS